jgi:ATP-dependent DNA helicase RecG
MREHQNVEWKQSWREALLNAVMHKDVTVSKLAELLGLSTTAVENNIRQLKAQGHLKRHGPAKGGYWEVLK